MTAKPLGLSRDERIRSPVHFKRAYDRKCSASDSWLIIYGCLNDLPHARLGLSVSRKWGKANQRNYLRRLYREAFRLSKPLIPTGLDYVFIPRTAEGVTLESLKASVQQLTQQVAIRCRRDPKRYPPTRPAPS